MQIELNPTEREILASIVKRGEIKMTPKNLLHVWHLQNKGIVRIDEESLTVRWHARKK